FAGVPALERFGFPDEPVLSDEAAAGGSTYDPPEPIQEIRPQDAPTEEYNFEYRSEETYFEPAGEATAETVESAESPVVGFDQSQEFAQTGEGGEQQAESAPEASEAQAEEPAQMPASTP